MNDMLISAYVRAQGLRDSVLGALRRGVAAMQPESGQDLVEYAVLIGAVAVVAAIALLFVGSALDFGTFRNRINDCITFDSGCGNW